MKNTGFKEEPLQVEDYIAGVSSNIEYFVRIVDSNWTQWLPKDELQKKGITETMSCVSFAAMNCLEIQLNWAIDNGTITAEAMNFLYKNGYIEDGKVNFSDRYIAILSGTTNKGNTLNRVANTIRGKGVIPESMLPFEGKTFDEYHGAEITEEMLKLGKEFMNHFNIQHEWISDIKKHLRQTPLWIAAATCPGWATKNPVPACSKKVNHSTTIFNIADEQYIEDYDHYKPFKKKLDIEYKIPWRKKLLITMKAEFTQVEIADAKKYALQLKDSHTSYFFRPEASGEAYYIELDGSIKYLLGKKCPLFDSLIKDKVIFGLSEKDFERLKAGLIK